MNDQLRQQELGVLPRRHRTGTVPLRTAPPAADRPPRLALVTGAQPGDVAGDRSSCVAGGLVAKKPPLYLGSAAGVSSNGRKMCGYLRERKKAQRRAVSLGSGERDGGPIRLRRARSDTGASTRRQQKDRAAAPRRSVDLERAARAEMAGDGRARWVAASARPAARRWRTGLSTGALRAERAGAGGVAPAAAGVLAGAWPDVLALETVPASG